MKITLGLFALLFVTNLFACPYCAGNGQGGKDSNTTIVLICFIAAIYIPYAIIYRLIKKQRAFQAANDNTGSTNS